MENHSEIEFIKLVAAGMILAFVLASSIVVFVLIYQRKLSKQVLNIQKMKLNHQEMLIQSNIQITESERRQFATNLHDVLGGQVAIAKITLSSVEEAEIENQETIKKTLDLLDGISTSIRSISYDIMPPVLIKLGLSKAMDDYLRKLPSSDVESQFHSDIGDRRFSPDNELHAYRICQEAITNALKYAQCSKIMIHLTTSEQGLLEFEISDNGIGIQKKTFQGSGLLNMEHRAKLMGSKLEVTSDASGTIISLKSN